jgi:DNA-binding phage protein
MLTQKFVSTVRNANRPVYRIAREAGVSPDYLYKALLGYHQPKFADRRILEVGRTVGLDPSECFQGAAE